MKIVRCVFMFDGEAMQYFFDHQYDEAVDDQVNCNRVLEDFIAALTDGKVLTAMKQMQEGNSQPVLLNLKHVTEVRVFSISVYTTQVKDAKE